MQEQNALLAEQAPTDGGVKAAPPPMPVADASTPPPLPVPDPAPTTPPPAASAPAPPAAGAPAPVPPLGDQHGGPADELPAEQEPEPETTTVSAEVIDTEDGELAAGDGGEGEDQFETLPHLGGPSAPVEQPVPQAKGYWDVDPDKLAGFATAVEFARLGLAQVQSRVELMQGEAYTPQLGTSPVGQQLARKFDDRLNGDNGLRGLLAEAMRRMDQFIESAEKVRDSYTESERLAQETMARTEQNMDG
ncbi:hypothetical protein [Actinokineospora pegani]|uniref:hypothetical protein n=1 Tax=Actinokineospora pegani TaxID=2654637 RepID=UPI0018D287A0|nr:hypothetical protein [Actinokineospora pegani]